MQAAPAAFSLSTQIATAKCQLQQIGVMPVDMQNLRPLVWTKINGVKARFVLNSGSFYSMITRDAAVRYQLRIEPILGDKYHIQGPGGAEEAQRTTVESFQFVGMPLSNLQFLVIHENWSDLTASRIC